MSMKLKKVIDDRNGKIVGLIGYDFNENGDLIFQGSRVHPNDTYDKTIGKDLVTRRFNDSPFVATGLEIVDHFYGSVEPLAPLMLPVLFRSEVAVEMKAFLSDFFTEVVEADSAFCLSPNMAIAYAMDALGFDLEICR